MLNSKIPGVSGHKDYSLRNIRMSGLIDYVRATVRLISSVKTIF